MNHFDPNQRRHLFRILSLLILCCSLAFTCDRKKKVKVGFVGSLTGHYADLGVEARNAVLLAIDEINQSGGVKGRPVELIVKDDRHDANMAIQVDKELIAEGVTAIIGHSTSMMSMAVYPLINQEKRVLISPTTSTEELSRIDDHFFRTTPSNKESVEQLATYVFEAMGIRNVTVMLDFSNKAYSGKYYRFFKTEFERRGGKIVHVKTFTPEAETVYSELLEGMPVSESVFIVASPIPTAMICQQLRKLYPKQTLIASGWAHTSDLIRYGGSSVEGVLLSNSFNEESAHEDYLRFKDRYQRRFGYKPGFSALKAYEAMLVIYQALRVSTDPDKMKSSILSQTSFKGLQGDFKLDRYGDVEKKAFIFKIQNRKYTLIDE